MINVTIESPNVVAERIKHFQIENHLKAELHYAQRTERIEKTVAQLISLINKELKTLENRAFTFAITDTIYKDCACDSSEELDEAIKMVREIYSNGGYNIEKYYYSESWHKRSGKIAYFIFCF